MREPQRHPQHERERPRRERSSRTTPGSWPRPGRLDDVLVRGAGSPCRVRRSAARRRSTVANASATSGRTGPPEAVRGARHAYTPDELRARLERALVLALRLDVQLGDTRSARGDPRTEPDRQLTADDERRDRQRRTAAARRRAAAPSLAVSIQNGAWKSAPRMWPTYAATPTSSPKMTQAPQRPRLMIAPSSQNAMKKTTTGTQSDQVPRATRAVAEDVADDDLAVDQRRCRATPRGRGCANDSAARRPIAPAAARLPRGRGDFGRLDEDRLRAA